MSVPAIVCPCISRFDLLEQMVLSIDYPVERVVIIDNSCSGYELGVAPPDFVGRVDYIRPILNLGYPGGLNAGFIQTPESPWWVFCNADITFGPGSLARTEELMTATADARFVTSRAVAYAFGALNQAALKTVGLFDEWSCYPAYFDDNDWDYRRSLAGVERIEADLGVHHGDHRGEGSLTIRSSDRYRRANDRTFQINRSNYILKWGGVPGEEKFTTPWNSGLPLWCLRPDIDGIRDRLW